VANLLGDDGERRTGLGMAHQLPRPLLGKSVAQSMRAGLFPGASTLAREKDAVYV